MFQSSFWSGSLESGFSFSFDNWTRTTRTQVNEYAPLYAALDRVRGRGDGD
jgi:hypothetical protein